jgi:DNA mismatch repair protein MutS
MLQRSDNQKLSDEYFQFYNKYREEYGEKTCILMLVGFFYEIQMVKNEEENIGNLEEISEILNIQITKKNKSISKVDRTNYNFGGFPKHALAKYITLLLENGYTVVVVDQKDEGGKKQKRCISGIYSPGIQPLDLVNDRGSTDGNNLTSVMIEMHVASSNRVQSISYSICNINTSTNVFDVYESGVDITNEATLSNTFESSLDDVYRIMLRYNSKEVNFTVKCKQKDIIPKHFEAQFVKEYLNLYDSSFHWGRVDTSDESRVDYQNAFLGKIYKHVNFGVLSPLESFDLEHLQLSSLNCISIIKFIAKHDEKYVENLACPKIINEYKHLVLEMNTMHQLNILPDNKNVRYGSLFGVINKTKTAIGKRGLKNMLCKPLKSREEIQKRFDFCERLESGVEEGSLERALDNICDFERLHRKMSLGMLQPYEFYNLNTAYEGILELQGLVHSDGLHTDTVCKLVTYMKDYNDVFEIEEMKRYNFNEQGGSFFRRGNVEEIDIIVSKIKEIEARVEVLRLNMTRNGQSDWVKVAYTEQDGYYFTCTKIRTDLLVKAMGKDAEELIIKNNTSTCKITSAELKRLSMNLVKVNELYRTRARSVYIEYLREMCSKYSDIFVELRDFVERVDIAQSNNKCRRLYKYCRPEVVNGESFVKARGLRHPIIERINEKTEYVPNDITLDSERSGMILYALNSCGKSSLLRSIGLCIVMAQCGLYVPCTELQFAPFDSIVTQVDMIDNMWKAQSSFVTEMVGLKKIVKMANKNCLVLCDELTKGTEVYSATSIFAATILSLLKKGVKFLFTTHLLDVAKLDVIQSRDDLQVCHLSVRVESKQIVFTRQLQEGPCSELYGLEVAKAVGIDGDLMEEAFEIRNLIMNRSAEVVKKKRSRYNRSKILSECEICGYTPVKHTDMPLDTHHIKFQCTADENNFTGHYHKNAAFNLVSLCKRCHVDVHDGKLTINGYIQTTTGRQLDLK